MFTGIVTDVGRIRTVRETNGIVVDVSDAEIIEAKSVVDASGVGCEPASAATTANRAHFHPSLSTIMIPPRLSET